MKKYIILASAMALVSGAAMAQDADMLRIYINPGHGSWTGNDRPMQVIGKPVYSATNTDTTGFFESNTDLQKGFGLLEKLIDMGFTFDRTLNQEGERWEIGAARDLSNNLVMSRVKNGPYEANNTTSSPNYELYNRGLYDIACEVEYNEFDMFISIHSNAATEASTTNYHLFMYRGKNGIQNVAAQGSYEMCEAASKYSFPNIHNAWSVGYTYINGDVDFMGGGSGSTNDMGYYGYLGVLKHGCPGYLVEGYFHTYQPGRHRAMNFDVDFEEGCAYARGVAEYFGLERDNTGDIYGIVRDAHEKFTHDLYHPRPQTDDVYLPLNGCKVYLNKDGVKIREYVTDNFYNGAFLFFDLEPGKYTLTFDHPDYREAGPVEVEVVPGDCVYPRAFLENVNYELPVDVEVNYPDEVNNKAIGAAPEYNMVQSYVDQPIAGLEGKTVRRVVSRGDKVYVLALDGDDEPTLIVYDARTKSVLAEVSTEGCTGNQLRLSDIQVTADGVLVGSAKEKLQYSDEYVDAGESRGTLRFYRWNNDLVTGLPSGDPEEWFTTQNPGLWYRAYSGETFAYSGTTKDGKLVYSAETTGDSQGIRTVTVSILNNEKSAEDVHKPDVAQSCRKVLGDDYRYVTSPLDDDDYMVVGSGSDNGVLEYGFAHADGTGPKARLSDGIIPNHTSRVNFLRYAGHSFMAAPLTEDGKNVGVRLVDITGGLENAVIVSTSNTSVEGYEAGSVGIAGVSAVTRNADETVTDADIIIYLTRDDKITRFTTENVGQPVRRAQYAYDLGLLVDDASKDYVVTFKSTGDAPSARIILKDMANGNEKVVDAGAVDAGDNSVVVYSSDLDSESSYSWSVEITSDPVCVSSPIFTAEPISKATRGGVAWINDPESVNFGKVIVSYGYAQGVDVYSPDLKKEGRFMTENSPWSPSKINSPYRIGQRGGIAYLTDWSDPGAGYWMFDASDPTSVTDFMQGVNDGTGAHIVDGASIGGGSTCVSFCGSGEDTKMYTFVEDYPSGNSTMSLCRYDVGTTETLAKAPDKTFGDITARSYMTGTNVEVVALPDGLFVSQARAIGNNIEKGPAFIYIDNDGKVLFNSYSLTDNLTSCGSGLAITDDLTMMAVSECKNGIGIWDVEWNGNVPSLTKRYMIPGSEGADEISQLAFDNAGNLYSFHRGNKGLEVYSLRNEMPKAVTPARSSLVIKGSAAGVEDVSVDAIDVDSPVEYYNVQGIKMQGDNLPAGVYIRVQGKTATKVVVK